MFQALRLKNLTRALHDAFATNTMI